MTFIVGPDQPGSVPPSARRRRFASASVYRFPIENEVNVTMEFPNQQAQLRVLASPVWGLFNQGGAAK